MLLSTVLKIAGGLRDLWSRTFLYIIESSSLIEQTALKFPSCFILLSTVLEIEKRFVE